MKITREINGVKLEIELTRNEMCLAYEEIRRDTWESCIRHQIEMNSQNLRLTEDFDEEETDVLGKINLRVNHNKHFYSDWYVGSAIYYRPDYLSNEYKDIYGGINLNYVF